MPPGMPLGDPAKARLADVFAGANSGTCSSPWPLPADKASAPNAVNRMRLNICMGFPIVKVQVACQQQCRQVGTCGRR
ncbi:hypothetical protein [Burkholderia sp. AU19243]|uniref:hypothetical protein n=1 Tax=Burkholderia sp. AU19243 TaxID=2824810 RepID=UPI002013A4AE|nr:hypothetical protein [Burkholderia sp. AU19243]